MNNELNEYFDILCNNDYPTFIDKYFEVEELKRLKNIGQFCGCDYNKLYNIRYWYSRFDHSVATALITWNFTKSKKETLAALFHDLGTPAFSHCIDFMLGDSVNQESSEKSIKEVISKSSDILRLLELDGVSINDVTAIYPIVENKSPRLCADRLEGVLHTIHIWLNKWSLDQVKAVYSELTVHINEDNLVEIGFKSKEAAETFFSAVYEYSMALQKSENKFTMKYIADVIKKLINKNILSLSDLYTSSEASIIDLLKKNELTWDLFTSVTSLKRSELPSSFYNVSLDTKKRYVIPLCNDLNVVRLDKVSDEVETLLNDYKNFNDSKYCYVEGLKLEEVI